jgi:hypothetical protein
MDAAIRGLEIERDWNEEAARRYQDYEDGKDRSDPGSKCLSPVGSPRL